MIRPLDFVYQNFTFQISGKDLKIAFCFKLGPNIEFKPKVIVKNIDRERLKKIDAGVLNNLIFHLGMAEIPTYWKATCSPNIVIKAGYLNKEQIGWWKKLILKGMGQFFYENKMDFQVPEILIRNNYTVVQLLRNDDVLNQRKTLVAVGGGKDSVVTMELLKKRRRRFSCFSLNPTPAAKKIMKLAGCKNPIIVEREIDPKLLELNRKGYYNGHTPFSSYLAFLSVLLGAIFNYKYLAFSNEKSADEGNLKYLRQIINHQWSKSSEFERMFRYYSQKYLAKNIHYFSFLRLFSELQISKMFSKYPRYFSAFISCNRQKGQRWCAKCPKCLSTFAFLYPFIEEKKLIKIFGKNLFEEKNLVPLMERLIGKKDFKPFECVGTIKENQKAFYLSLKKAKRAGKLPHLLKHYKA